MVRLVAVDVVVVVEVVVGESVTGVGALVGCRWFVVVRDDDDVAFVSGGVGEW